MALSPRDKLAAGMIRVVDPGKRKDGQSIGIAPYFGVLLRGLIRREFSPEQAAIMEALGMSPTLAVSRDGILWWSAKFVSSITSDELAGVLVHEAMHLALKHADRATALGIKPEPSIEMHSKARRWNCACFPPGTFVGDVPIETVEAGDAILGADNTWGTVTTPMSRLHDGELVSIRASGCLPVEATPEHPILVSRKRKGYPVRLLDPEWVTAKDVHAGDYVYFGVPAPTTDVTVLSVEEFTTIGVNGRGANRVVLKDGFPLTEDTAWLLGLWTAEGSWGSDSCVLSLGAHELDLASRAINVASSLGFAAGVSSPDYRTKSSVQVHLGGPVLARAFSAWCGRGAHNKRVPEFILRHSDTAIKKAFLDGLDDGDGCYTKSNQQHVIGVASKRLAAGVQLLLAAIGRYGWMRIVEQKEGRMIHGQALPKGLLYTITWSDSPGAGTRQMNGKTINSHSRRWRHTKHGISVPVTAVTRRHYAGPVYNFETSIHTYTAGGLVVHNCDLAINTDVRKFAALPKDVMFPEKFGFPVGLTAEAYYKLLEEQEKKQQQKQGGGQGSGPGQSGAPGNGKPSVTAGHCGGCAQHPVPGEPDPTGKPGEGRSEAELERMRRATAEAVKDYASKNRGNVPASLERWADEQLKPARIPWRTKLARVIRGAVAYRAGSADLTWGRVSRRQAGVGFGVGRPIVPALHAPQPNVGCLVDVSGSVSEDALTDAMAEANGVIRAVGGEITFAVVDAALHGIKQVASVKDAIAMLKGGGGTDMKPGIEALSKHKPRPDVVVIFTDAYIGDPGPEPPFSVIWVVIQGDKSFAPAFGDVIQVEEDAA